jgi:hypothetical protein
MRSLLVKLGIISPRIIVVHAETVDIEKLKNDLGASFIVVAIQAPSNGMVPFPYEVK